MSASTSRQAPVPAQPENTYTPQQGLALSEGAARATPAHLVIAADFLAQVLEANNVPYAFMGGFSLKIRGSQRDTQDVDVAVGCTMQRLIEVISAQENAVRPLGPVSGVMRIFVKTSLPEQSNPDTRYVAVDLILRGSLGAPDDPSTESEILAVQTTTGEKRYRVLNLKATMAAKLGAFFGRQGKSDLDDLLYLTLHFTEAVWNIKDQLNKEYRQAFINGLYRTYAKTMSKGDLKKVQMALGIAGPDF